ncbi:MAG: DNA polymerase I [Alphaproteobacteria bacterium]
MTEAAPAINPDPARTLYLVDGSGYIFRAYHALPPLTRPDGTPIGAVAGFCNMLAKLLREIGAEHIGVIFDAGRKTFRNDFYPEYKAHRPPAPEDLIPQFPLIREATRAFGVPAIEADNYEADDLIAAYARAARERNWEVRIVSADKDLMQLIRDGVSLYDPLKSKLIGAAEVMEKFGVAPDRVIDVQALAGDSTDNVPGVPGIGVKTAAELINIYGSLDALLERAAEIKQPKRRELLIQHAEQARISRRLVTLDENAPMPAPVEDLIVKQDPAVLRAFLTAQNFKSLLTRLGHAAAPTVSEQPQAPAQTVEPLPESKSLIPQHYDLIQDAAALKSWLAKSGDYLAIDTETTSLTPSTTTLVGISLARAPGEACYIPVNHRDPQASASGELDFGGGNRPRQMTPAQAAEILAPYLADPALLKIGHNLKFDMQVLAQHGLTMASIDDTMLLSYALAAGLHGHGLDDLALLHCGHKMISFAEVTGSGKSRISFDRVPLDQACAYAAEDADFTLRLWLKLKPEIARQHVTRVYERIERPLIPIVAAMERDGVLIDPHVLQNLSQDFGKRLMVLETEIHRLAGREFNVGSPKQLGEVLFAELGLPGGEKGKTGAYSTGSEILEPLAEQGHEIAAKVLDWRALAKLMSTYTDSLQKQIDARTGRVHTSFSLVGAATGRLSSTEPNLQNIPIRTEDGRAIRRAFVAAEGNILLSVDYSQIELRLAAAMAGITALADAFRQGADIHALTASQVFGIPLDQMTPDRRRAAKAINFGIIYGISGFGLGRQIGIAPGEANAFIRQYLDRYHELREWMEKTKAFAREHGYVETLFGRRIHIGGIGEKNAARRNFAERQAINAPLQGTAADIMKRAMIRIPPALEAAGLKGKMLLQVHDELLFEIPQSEAEATAALVKSVMESAPAPAVTLSVPLVAETGLAKNWAEAH